MSKITIKQLADDFDSLKRNAEKPVEHNPVEFKDKTRAFIAQVMVFGYFGLILIVIIGAPIYNIFTNEETLLINDLISTLSAIIGAPFGFVMGYYFKGSEKE